MIASAIFRIASAILPFFGKFKTPLWVCLSSIGRGIVLKAKEPERPLTAKAVPSGSGISYEH